MNYRVLKTGWLDRTYVNEGTVLNLTATQAKYHLMAGRVGEVIDGAVVTPEFPSRKAVLTRRVKRTVGTSDDPSL